MKHWSPSNDMVNGCLTTVITIVGQGVTSIGTMVDVEFVGSRVIKKPAFRQHEEDNAVLYRPASRRKINFLRITYIQI